MKVIKLIESEGSQLYKSFKENFPRNKKIDVILYGAGEKARLFLDSYKNVNVRFCCDDDAEKIGSYIDGIPIISADELMISHKNLPIIITSKWSDDISKRLKAKEIKYIYHRFSLEYLMHMKELQEAFDLLEDDMSRDVFLALVKYVFKQDPSVFEAITADDRQYFLEDIFSFGADETIVDGGAFTGDTLQSYISVSKGIFKNYYCFEPDSINFNKLKCYVSTLESNDKVKIFQQGLFSSDNHIRFSSLNNSASCINPFSESFKDVTSLDKLLGLEEVSMIKLDIEGCEYEALIGSKNTIQINKPKLAICVYHLASDLWKIPLLLKSFSEDYKLYLRHHNKKCWYETVIYAAV